MSGTILQQSHWQFSTSAHLGNINPASHPDNESQQASVGIDIETRACVQCHDDVTVTIMPKHETSWQKADRWSRMKDHPVGTDYRYSAQKNPGRFKTFFDQDQKTRLFNGKVGCGSCHSLYADSTSFIVAPDEKVLCRNCHIR
jgi:predicted CXXCH cytochrome family protein